MFVISQIPVADTRRFLAADTRRLPLPDWPDAQPGREFVRALGGVKPRMRGGVAPWVGEEVYCDARGAVRFPAARGVWAPVHEPGVPRFRWAFRRLLSDGGVVTRLEYGVARRWMPASFNGGWGAARVGRACAGGAIEVRAPDGAWQRSSLAHADAPLARLLAACTTSRRPPDGFAPDPRWLTPGRPLMLVEHWSDETPDGEPPGRRAAPAAEGATLSYELVVHEGRYVGVWYLALDDDHDEVALRRLRIHLFRIHAERECLKQVLRGIARQEIPFVRGTQAADDLQRYLNDAFKRIFQPSYFGLPQAEVLRAAYDSDELIAEGERASLLAKLADARLNLQRRIAEGTREGGTYFYT